MPLNGSAITSDTTECITAGPRFRHTILVAVSYNLPARTTGIGLVVRATDKPKQNGAIVSQHSEAHPGVGPTGTQETAILCALELANRMGWRFVRVKSDSPLRKRLKESYRSGIDREAEGPVGAILRLADTFDEVQFRHIGRRKNPEARKLARAGAGYVDKACDDDGEPIWWEIGVDAEIREAEQVGRALDDIPF